MNAKLLIAGIMLSAVAMGQQQVSLLGTLPSEVAESSGLAWYKEQLITHNDSGNEPYLYLINPTTRELTRKVLVSNATNVDWEDLAQDDNYLYVADIGNYSGNRKDLVIYKVSKGDLDAADTVQAAHIEFRYEDQTDFAAGSRSDWDAEALLLIGDSLIIFTKQWQSNGTKAYVVPATPGNHIARLLGTYASNGLVTGATYNTASGIAYLCGYTALLQPFLLRMEGTNEGNPFAGTVTRTVPELGLAQVEGIAAYNASTYFLTSEKFENSILPIGMPASLFSFTTADTVVEPPDSGESLPGENPGTDSPDGADNQSDLLIFQTYGAKSIEYEIFREEPVYGRAVFDALGRRVLYTEANKFNGNTIDLSPLGSAVYYLTFYFQGKTITKPFFVY